MCVEVWAECVLLACVGLCVWLNTRKQSVRRCPLSPLHIASIPLCMHRSSLLFSRDWGSLFAGAVLHVQPRILASGAPAAAACSRGALALSREPSSVAGTQRPAPRKKRKKIGLRPALTRSGWPNYARGPWTSPRPSATSSLVCECLAPPRSIHHIQGPGAGDPVAPKREYVLGPGPLSLSASAPLQRAQRATSFSASTEGWGDLGTSAANARSCALARSADSTHFRAAGGRAKRRCCSAVAQRTSRARTEDPGCAR
jgi:hypothetical protein